MLEHRCAEGVMRPSSNAHNRYVMLKRSAVRNLTDSPKRRAMSDASILLA